MAIKFLQGLADTVAIRVYICMPVTSAVRTSESKSPAGMRPHKTLCRPALSEEDECCRTAQAWDGTNAG